MTPRRHAGYERIKRLIDTVCAALLLLVLGLPLLVLGLLVRLTSPGPALFRQIRLGRGGKPFRCLKLRTMYRDAPPSCPTAALRSPEKHITPLGRWLRRSSLDELPQLWNVLRGEMSLVGPRPLIPEEGRVHELRRRTGVDRLRPGMTGLAQIRGRDRLSDEEKVRWDAAYARRRSLREDGRILLLTLWRVLRGADVREGGRSDDDQPPL